MEATTRCAAVLLVLLLTQGKAHTPALMRGIYQMIALTLIITQCAKKGMNIEFATSNDSTADCGPQTFSLTCFVLYFIFVHMQNFGCKNMETFIFL